MVASLPLGHGNDGVVFDAARRRIITTNGIEANIVIYHQDDADHYRIEQAVATRPEARTIAYDPTDARIFTVTAEGVLNPAAAANSGPSAFYPNAYYDDNFVVLTYAPGWQIAKTPRSTPVMFKPVPAAKRSFAMPDQPDRDAGSPSSRHAGCRHHSAADVRGAACARHRLCPPGPAAQGTSRYRSPFSRWAASPAPRLAAACRCCDRLARRPFSRPSCRPGWSMSIFCPAIWWHR